MNPEKFLQVASVRLEADVDSLLASLHVRKTALVGFKFDKVHTHVAMLRGECVKLERRLQDARENLESVQFAARRMPQIAAIREFQTQRRGTRNCRMTEKVLRDVAECVDNASIVLASECMSQSSQTVFGCKGSMMTGR